MTQIDDIEQLLLVDKSFQHILKFAPESQRELMTFELAKYFTALIATQIQEARIDELELAVKSFEWGKGTDYLTDRIAWVKRNTPDHWAIHGDELPSASLTRALIDEDIEKCEQHIAEMEEELKKRRPNQPTKANKENDK